MKMRNIFIIILIFVISLFFNNNVFAEYYKGKTFPSDKHLKNLKHRCVFIKSFGKYKNVDGSYTLFFKLTRRLSGKKITEIRPMRILQLDTKLWIAISPITGLPLVINEIE